MRLPLIVGSKQALVDPQGTRNRCSNEIAHE
jgi:hypothetical protein